MGDNDSLNEKDLKQGDLKQGDLKQGVFDVLIKENQELHKQNKWKNAIIATIISSVVTFLLSGIFFTAYNYLWHIRIDIVELKSEVKYIEKHYQLSNTNK